MWWFHSGVDFILGDADAAYFVNANALFPDKSVGKLLHVNIDNVTDGIYRGYPSISEQDVSDWVQAVGGSQKYVSIYNKSQTTLKDKRTLESWTISNLPQVLAKCGAYFDYYGGTAATQLVVDPDGTTVTPTFTVRPTPPPTASISLGKSSYKAGEMVQINLGAQVNAYYTNWHFEAVRVTGPNGYDRYLPVDTGANGRAAPATGLNFPWYGEQTGVLTAVYGGNQPAPYKETASLDTSNLSAGTYTVTYTLWDAVGRPASNGGSTGSVSASFTVDAPPGGNTGGGGTGPGGTCLPLPAAPAPRPPFDDQVTWSSLGNGNGRLTWVHHTFTVKTTSGSDANGCSTVSYQQVETKTTQSQTYNAAMNSGEITGLTYDPGRPGNMWLPISAADWGVSATPDGFWGPLNQEHGWTGFESGGPDANQVTRTVSFGGEEYQIYGRGQGEPTPWVYARPGSSFAFRMVWKGPPTALPTSGTASYRMTNPDGTSYSWTQDLVIHPKTLLSEGTDLVALNTPPDYAYEAVSAATQLPKHTLTANGEPELAAWSLSEDEEMAKANGANIDVTVKLHTPYGDVTFTQPNMVTLFSYPSWYQTHLTTTNSMQ